VLGLIVFILAAAPVMSSVSSEEGSVPLPVPDTVFASGDSEAPTDQPLPPDFVVGVDEGDGSVGVGAVLPAGAQTSTGSGSVRPRCGWEKALVGDFRDTPDVTPGEGERSTGQVAQVGADGGVLSWGGGRLVPVRDLSLCG